MEPQAIQLVRGRRAPSDRRLFLVSMLLGYCLSFGGGMLLAVQIAVPVDDDSTRSELVEGVDGDWAAPEVTPRAPDPDDWAQDVWPLDAERRHQERPKAPVRCATAPDRVDELWDAKAAIGELPLSPTAIH